METLKTQHMMIHFTDLPLGIAPYPFFYNKDIFEKHGIEVPETYKELLESIDILNKDDLYPIALANQPKVARRFLLVNVLC